MKKPHEVNCYEDLRLRLDAYPADAKGCVKLVVVTNNATRAFLKSDNWELRRGDVVSCLFQKDLDWPPLAMLFGWSPDGCQIVGREPCPHTGTDGTVKCKVCGIPATTFINGARLWLYTHHGETCLNPGFNLDIEIEKR